MKLRETVGVIGNKKFLKCSMLNVDGMSNSSFEDVKNVLCTKQSDVCVILETKRREEEVGRDIAIDGYTVRELRRSDVAGDKGGGGIAVYTRQLDSLVFHDYSPEIEEQDCHFVSKERIWITTKSSSMKTAICGAYYGCQYPDNRHLEWNRAIYNVVQKEAATLRGQGYRVVILADFNGHIGSEPGVGVVGNNPDINSNGKLLLDFLHTSHMRHVNGVQGLTRGLWTRQMGSSKSILDLSLVSEEHMATVESLEIDDRGRWGGSSDHNWSFLVLRDNFVLKRRILNIPSRKQTWRIVDDQDWTEFKEVARARLQGRDMENMSVDELGSLVSSTLLMAGRETIGLRTAGGKKSKPKFLPPHLVGELRLKRQLEREWKSASTDSLPSTQELEKKFLAQKQVVNEMLFLHNNMDRGKIMRDCSGTSRKARKNFWSHVSTKVKQSMDITAVVDPESGVLKCSRDEIKEQVEKHFCKVFQGSMEMVEEPDDQYHTPQYKQSHIGEHNYSVSAGPKLPKINESGSLHEDPSGWLDEKYGMGEVKRAISLMKGGRARGWDNIPNEFLMNSPDEVIEAVTVLFNKIQQAGVVPRGWNKGRITLIHKKGLRELLGNYRPVTVIISLSGLYSRVLNWRLTEVVEVHSLLGEEQNGFRKGRTMTDNNFILDTVLWKAKALAKKIHLCYVDVSKAYDSINRSILWSRLSSMGFGGHFLQSLQALYSGDTVDSSVNGISTCPVYLRRGLRQGCSLSPILFALYISDIGNDLTLSTVGFEVGGLVVSGLLFADDIVLISRDSEGLMSLISLVKKHCDGLRLEISVSKSNVVSPGDQQQWDLYGSEGELVLSLKSVLSYKYLGTDTTLLMSSTGSRLQQRCITTANRYKYACFYIGKTGPDVVDAALATWNNIAVPSIMTGCDVIPFTETTIEAIERVQSKLAKIILGLGQYAPNVCAQTELGLKPFRQLLWQHQLKYYMRLIALPESRWVSRTIQDHLSGEWQSPYVAYIARVREQLGLYQMPPTEKILKLHMDEWFLGATNRRLSSLSLPCVAPLVSWGRQPYVYENESCSYVAQFRMGCASLGNRAPILEGYRMKRCFLCNGDLDELHIAFVCPALEKLRRECVSLSSFRHMGLWRSFTMGDIFVKFVNGLDWDGSSVERAVYAQRGMMLKTMKLGWKRLAGYTIVFNCLI